MKAGTVKRKLPAAEAVPKQCVPLSESSVQFLNREAEKEF